MIRVGDRSGFLVVQQIEKFNHGYRLKCRCDCGAAFNARAGRFSRGITKSCGCARNAGKVTDITGMRFGRLVAISRAPSVSQGTGVASAWNCICDCGKTAIKTGHALRSSGGFISCGCRAISGNTTHGMSKDRVYMRWNNMMRRCTSAKSKSFPNYGGRGIAVCERWHNFANFYADMGPPPFAGATIERTDNDGDYCPENCRWATRMTQATNKRNTRRITYNGRTMCLSHWADEIGISRRSLKGRLDAGWSIERAVTTPKMR